MKVNHAPPPATPVVIRPPKPPAPAPAPQEAPPSVGGLDSNGDHDGPKGRKVDAKA
jgi:hypothetical protein